MGGVFVACEAAVEAVVVGAWSSRTVEVGGFETLI